MLRVLFWFVVSGLAAGIAAAPFYALNDGSDKGCLGTIGSFVGGVVFFAVLLRIWIFF